MQPRMIHPEGWAPALGYANGMLMPDGTLHIGGQIGWNKDKKFTANDFCGQMEQILSNIAEIVQAAGGSVGDVGRLTWFVKDKSEYLANLGQLYLPNSFQKLKAVKSNGSDLRREIDAFALP